MIVVVGVEMKLRKLVWAVGIRSAMFVQYRSNFTFYTKNDLLCQLWCSM